MTTLKTSTTNSGDGTTAPHCIVLRENSHDYVVHLLNLQTNGFSSGHYVPKGSEDAFKKATQSYIQRCQESHVEP